MMNNSSVSTILVILAVSVTALFFVFYMLRKKVSNTNKYTGSYGKDSKEENATGLGLSLGMSFGLLMGTLMDNIALGITLGPALGIMPEAVLGKNNEKKR